MVFEQLLGENLIRKGEAIKTSSLEGKNLLIYFSAHWCPPCRGFTPALVKFYEDLRSKRDDFEIVFVSSDKDQASFDEYYGEMPWAALPFSERDLKQKLSSKFKVEGIPTLVVLDKAGDLITKGGRNQVMADPEGKDFPWVPKPLEELLGTSFVDPSGKEVALDPKGKVLGLYFSAHWCPPCKMFTPVLAEKYKGQLKPAHPDDFEIIFVSSDRDEASFKEYHGSMPWLAVPFSDAARREALGSRFEVAGIPSLVFLNGDLSIANADGVSAIQEDLPFPFRPPPVRIMSGSNMEAVNDSPSLLLFAPADGEPSKEELERHCEPYVKALLPVSERCKAEGKEMVFFVVAEPKASKAIGGFINRKDDQALILLDIPGQAKYLLPGDRKASDLSTPDIDAFVSDYFAEKLPKTGIRA